MERAGPDEWGLCSTFFKLNYNSCQFALSLLALLFVFLKTCPIKEREKEREREREIDEEEGWEKVKDRETRNGETMFKRIITRH